MIQRKAAELNEGSAETDLINSLSEAIIGAAIEVHKVLGPGLLESAYEERLCHELRLRERPIQRQVPLDLDYKGTRIEHAYRLDMIVSGRIVVEVKAVDELTALHKMQLLTYLKLTDKRLGLLINFNVPILWKGVRRVVNHL